MLTRTSSTEPSFFPCAWSSSIPIHVLEAPPNLVCPMKRTVPFKSRTSTLLPTYIRGGRREVDCGKALVLTSIGATESRSKVKL